MLIIQILVYALLGAVLYVYFQAIKQSQQEKDIRKNNLDYHCFRCKKLISINDKKCPSCEFSTIYGNRKGKEWTIIIIVITWLFIVRKLSNQGLF